MENVSKIKKAQNETVMWGDLKRFQHIKQREINRWFQIAIEKINMSTTMWAYMLNILSPKLEPVSGYTRLKSYFKTEHSKRT